MDNLMTRISMVDYNTLTAVHNKNKKHKSDQVEYETAFFEAGMIEVLKQLALSKTVVLQDERPDTALFRDQVEKHADIYKQVLDLLGDEHRELLDDFEAASNFLGYLESEHAFIVGFMEGYKFLRQLHSSFGGAESL